MQSQNTGRIIGAGLLILLGIAFLAVQIFNINIWSLFSFSWPMFIILPGLAFLAVGVFGSKDAAPFAVPGAIVTGTGLILTFQLITDRWESWSYMWTLYPVFVGAALMLMGLRQGNRETYRNGMNAVMVGAVMFAIFGGFFELFIFNSVLDMGLLVPVVLIGLGVLLLFGNRTNRTVKSKNDDAPVFTGPRVVNGKPKNDYGSGADINPGLRRQIDEALAEDDPNEPRTTL